MIQNAAVLLSAINAKQSYVLLGYSYTTERIRYGELRSTGTKLLGLAILSKAIREAVGSIFYTLHRRA